MTQQNTWNIVQADGGLGISWNKIIRGESKYIMCGSNGYIAISDDLINWELQIVGKGDRNWNSITMCESGNNFTYVICGSKGDIAYTFDLVKWFVIPIHDKSLNDVKYNFDKCYVCGHGYLGISEDLKFWNNVIAVENMILNCMCVGFIGYTHKSVAAFGIGNKTVIVVCRYDSIHEKEIQNVNNKISNYISVTCNYRLGDIYLCDRHGKNIKLNRYMRKKSSRYHELHDDDYMVDSAHDGNNFIILSSFGYIYGRTTEEKIPGDIRWNAICVNQGVRIVCGVGYVAYM